MPDNQSDKRYITCNSTQERIAHGSRQHIGNILRVDSKHGKAQNTEEHGNEPTQHAELNSMREKTEHTHIVPSK